MLSHPDDDNENHDAPAASYSSEEVDRLLCALQELAGASSPIQREILEGFLNTSWIKYTPQSIVKYFEDVEDLQYSPAVEESVYDRFENDDGESHTRSGRWQSQRRYQSFGQMMKLWRESTGEDADRFIKHTLKMPDGTMSPEQLIHVEARDASFGPRLLRYISALCPEAIHASQYLQKIGYTQLFLESRRSHPEIIELTSDQFHQCVSHWWNEDTDASYGVCLKAIRLMHGLTQGQLASMEGVGVSQSTVVNWERNHLPPPSITQIRAIASGLGMEQRDAEILILKAWHKQLGIVEDPASTFGAYLKASREMHGLTQGQVASMEGVGVYQSAVANWERNHLPPPSIMQIRAIASGLGMGQRDAEILILKVWDKQLGIVEDPASTVGVCLKAIREMHGLNQEAFGDIDGVAVTKTTVANWERNHLPPPSITQIRAIASGLGMGQRVAESLIGKAWHKERGIVEDPASTFEACLKAFREMHGVSREQLAEMKGVAVNKTTVRRWEQATAPPPSIEKIRAIASGLGMEQRDAEILIHKAWHKQLEVVEDPASTFGACLRAFREMHGVSLERLVETKDLNVCRSTLANWETNDLPPPSITQIRAIASGLGMEQRDAEILIHKAWHKERGIVEDPASTFGACLKAIRAMHGLSQETLAEMKGVAVNKTTVRRWEQATAPPPSIEKIRAIASGLGMEHCVAESLILKAWRKELGIVKDPASTFVECLKAIRAMHGLSQETLAEMKGVAVNKTTVLWWEQATAPPPSIEKIRAIASGLGMEHCVAESLIRKAWHKEFGVVEDPASTFGACLKAIRAMHGVSQEALGDMEGVAVHKSTVLGWEVGKLYPNPAQLLSIGQHLQLTEEMIAHLQEKVSRERGSAEAGKADTWVHKTSSKDGWLR